MCSLRLSGPLILTTLLTTTLSRPAHAQSPRIPLSQSFTSAQTTTLNSPSADHEDPRDPKDLEPAFLPDAPTTHILPQPPPDPSFNGSILGTVLDSNGAEIPDAVVRLENTSSKVERTLLTDGTGFFKFDSVEPGTFNITVTSNGFDPWVSPDVPLHLGQSYDVPSVELHIASAEAMVMVTATRHDIAEDEMHLAEKQRVLGVFPNFYASYVWNAAPLSAGQKFRLALRTSADPVSIAIPAVIAGVEQSQNDLSGYGQGMQGYAKRFGAVSTDSLVSTMVGEAILPTVFHQDPRYFYKGTGSITSRALYAISTVVICKGDNGHWEPNYSNVLGNLASASISNLYYPPANRNGVHLTINNWLIGDASGAISSLFQEFLVKKLSRGVAPQTGP